MHTGSCLILCTAGLSPLDPGQWPAFLAVYAVFFAFQNVIRPVGYFVPFSHNLCTIISSSNTFSLFPNPLCKQVLSLFLSTLFSSLFRLSDNGGLTVGREKEAVGRQQHSHWTGRFPSKSPSITELFCGKMTTQILVVSLC